MEKTSHNIDAGSSQKRIAKNKSIKSQYIKISMIIGLLFFSVLAISFSIFILQEIKLLQEIGNQKLESIFPEIRKEIINELLVNNKRGLYSAIERIKHNFQIESLIITNANQSCTKYKNILYTKKICRTYKLNDIVPNKYIKLVLTLNGYKIFEMVVILLIIFIPLTLILIIIIYQLLTKFNRLVLAPIISLSQDPENRKSYPENMPREICDIYDHFMRFIKDIYPSYKINPQQGEKKMLVLTRVKGQSVIINNDIELNILAIRGNQVKIGIKAPLEISVRREELLPRIQQEQVAIESVARISAANTRV